MERVISGVLRRADQVLDPVNAGLEAVVELLARGLAVTPPVLLALLVGLLAWRGRRPVHGVVAGLGVHTIVLAGRWDETIESLSLAVVAGALALGVVTGGRVVASGLRRAGRLPPPRHRGVAPGLVLLVALAALAVEPIAAGASTRGWVLVAVLATASVLAGWTSPAGGTDLRTAPWTAWAALQVAFGVAVLVGLVDGRGLGGSIVRVLATSDELVATEPVLALAATVVVGWALGGGSPARASVQVDEPQRAAASQVPASHGDVDPEVSR